MVAVMDSRKTMSGKLTGPHEALLLAFTLAQGGVEKVWVFDAHGAFVSASAL